MLKKFTFLLFYIISLTGCVKVINDDLQSEETKLVINSVISPDSVFTVNVSKTSNIFDDESLNNLPFINDAEVKVYEDGDFLFNLDFDEHGYYFRDYYPETGKKYTVEVLQKDYKTISSTTVIPEAVKVKSFDTITEEWSDEYQAYYLSTSFKYDDPEDVENFYMLRGEAFSEDSDGNIYNLKLDFAVPEVDESLYDISWGNLLWSDRLIDGMNITVKFYFFFWSYVDDGTGDKELGQIKFRFYFTSVSKDYYLYLKSVNLYYETVDTDPFMEPVIIYSNVENGYGVFGSFSTDTNTLIYNIPFRGFKKGGRR